MATVLLIMVILGVLGSVVYTSVHTDITHSGKDLNRVRADFAAESAVQWGLAELGRDRPGHMAFTQATHSSDGKSPLPDKLGSGEANPQKFVPSEMASFPDAKTGRDKQGWIFENTVSAAKSISRGSQETLAFKAWYPDDSTLRITGRGTVNGVSAEMEFISHMKEYPVPF
jgi:Tfp pilus assembly protein PilX